MFVWFVLYLKGVHWFIDGIVQWNFKEYLQILSIMVPEECLLIVHAVLYLKKVNRLNIVTKCPLHPNRKFEFIWVFQECWHNFCVQVPEKCLLIVQCELHPKSVDWLSSLCCTWRVFTDYLMGVVQSNLRMLTYFYCSDCWRVFTDCPVWVAPKEY